MDFEIIVPIKVVSLEEMKELYPHPEPLMVEVIAGQFRAVSDE